jgi:hypothetical protein
MLNWNRAPIDCYRDRFLLWPVLLFSMLAIANIVAPESSADRVYGFKLAGCAVIAVLLAKERLVVLLAGAGFVAVKLGVALVITRDWKAYGLGLLVSIVIVLALLPALRRWKSSYENRPQTSVPGILFVVAGIVAAVTVVLLLKP